MIFWFRNKHKELRRERLLRFLFLPVKILGYLVDLTQLRDLENLRLRYARFFNYYLFRQYLDFQKKAKPPAIIRLLELEVIGKIAIAKVYHQTTQKDNTRSYIKKVLKKNFQIPAGQIRITKLDPHHLKLVFPIQK